MAFKAPFRRTWDVGSGGGRRAFPFRLPLEVGKDISLAMQWNFEVHGWEITRTWLSNNCGEISKFIVWRFQGRGFRIIHRLQRVSGGVQQILRVSDSTKCIRMIDWTVGFRNPKIFWNSGTDFLRYVLVFLVFDSWCYCHCHCHPPLQNVCSRPCEWGRIVHSGDMVRREAEISGDGMIDLIYHISPIRYNKPWKFLAESSRSTRN